MICSESLGVAMETAICMDGFSVGSISTRHLCASHGFVHSHIMSVSSSDETCSCNHATEIYRVDRQFFFTTMDRQLKSIGPHTASYYLTIDLRSLHAV